MSRTSLALGLAAALAMASLPGDAHADKIKNISCEQFLAMDEANQDDIVYWMHGVATASSKKAVAAEDVEVGFDAFGRPVAELVTACKGDRKASLWSKVRAHF